MKAVAKNIMERGSNIFFPLRIRLLERMEDRNGNGKFGEEIKI